MSEHMFGSPAEVMSHMVDITTVNEDLRLGRLGLLAHLDSTAAFSYDGFTSATSFLVARCGMGPGEANREVFLARSLEDMPYSTKLVAAGRLTVNQLEVLAHAAAAIPTSSPNPSRPWPSRCRDWTCVAPAGRSITGVRPTADQETSNPNRPLGCSSPKR